MGTYELDKKTVKGFFWIMFGFILQNSIHVLTKVVLVRLLLPVEFGVIATAYIFINFIRALNETGISSSIIQKSIIDDEIISSSFFFVILINLVFLAVALFFAPFVAGYFKTNSLSAVIRVLSVAAFIKSFTYIPITCLTKKLNFKNTVTPELGGVIIYSLTAITFAYLKFGLWSIVWATLASSIVASVLFFRISPRKPGFCFNFAKLKTLLNFGIKVNGVRVLNYIRHNIDYLVIAKFLGPVSLGYYFVAYELAFFYNKRTSLLYGKIFFPVLSQINDDEKLREYHFKTLKYSFIVGIPIYVILFALCKEIVLFLYGPKWVLSVIPMQALSLAACFKFTEGSVFSPLFVAKGNVEKLLKINLTMLLISTIAVFGGISYGINGVALFLLFAASLNFIIITISTAKILKQRWQEYAANIYSFVLPGAIMLSFLLFLNALNDLYHFGKIFLLVETVLALLLYAIILKLQKINLVLGLKSIYRILTS